jgi:hypothetical protein
MDQSDAGVDAVASLFGSGRIIWNPCTTWRRKTEDVI